MPTYEYKCDVCDHRFEAFQMMSDAPLRKCPRCGKKRLQRLIGMGAGIIFKGSGFYETDYKCKRAPSGEGAKAEASSAPKDATAKSDSTKTPSGGDGKSK